jgi:serine/threonine-protein kinase HipA
MLEVFAKEIEERATEVQSHAGQEGVPDVAELPEPEINSSPTAYQ